MAVNMDFRPSGRDEDLADELGVVGWNRNMCILMLVPVSQCVSWPIRSRVKLDMCRKLLECAVSAVG